MTYLAAWLVLTICLATVTTFAVWSRLDTGWRAATVSAFLVATVASYFVVQLPLGHPASGLPAGEYTVLGARIDVPTDSDAGAIYVLLDGPTPRYYRLPYTTGDANDLQQAMDGGDGVELSMGEGGESDFHEPPVAPDEAKIPEQIMEVM